MVTYILIAIIVVLAIQLRQLTIEIEDIEKTIFSEEYFDEILSELEDHILNKKEND